MDESEIKRFLKEKVQRRGTILGAQLGAIIASAFPGLRSDPKYPGLKRFIQSHCSDQIVRIGDHSGDDIYQFVSEGEPPVSIDSNASIPGAWNAFQHPTTDGKLYVKTATGELHVTIGANNTPSAEFALIPNVTREEHRAIAQAFLANIDEPSLWEFQQALTLEHYWPRWSKLVNRIPYRGAWKSFRFDKLCELFGARLRGHGLSDTLVSASLSQLLREKKEQSERTSKVAPRPPTEKTGIRFQHPESSLRAVIHSAIDSMAENELRRLWLPLGDVLDALKHPRQ